MMFTEKEQSRHLYVTDLCSSHIHLDNLSTMCVKLAVQRLSKKVASDMNNCDNETTKAVQEYIVACSKFWHISNTSIALRGREKEMIKQLDEVAEYFSKWKKGLEKQFATKTEQANHFISWPIMPDLIVRYLSGVHFQTPTMCLDNMHYCVCLLLCLILITILI